MELLSSYGAGGQSYSTIANSSCKKDDDDGIVDEKEDNINDGDMTVLLSLLKELERCCPSKKVFFLK